jgi:hypothetical protein
VQKLLIVLAWGALVAWGVRPVPGKGIPVGRRWARVYLAGRQGVAIGGVLLAGSIVTAGVSRAEDLAPVGAASRTEPAGS